MDGAISHKTMKASGHRSRDHPRLSSLGKELLSLLVKIAAILLVFLLVFTLVFGIDRYPDGSMAPAIQEGDLVIFYRLDKTYAIGDALLLSFEGQTQVRRVVAVAGDTVDVTEEGLLVNGALQQEPGIYEQTQRWEEGTSFPLTLEEGQVFVLGDARQTATDSRIYGPINVTDTLGKVMTLLRRNDI